MFDTTLSVEKRFLTKSFAHEILVRHYYYYMPYVIHNKTIKFFIAAGLALFILAGCSSNDDEANEANIKKEVHAQIIQEQDEVTSTLTVSGTIVPKQHSIVRSLIQGTVEFLIPVGERVFKGESLFSIRDANIENNYFNTLQSLNQTESLVSQRILQAELALNSAEANVVFAENNLKTTELQIIENTLFAENTALVSYASAYTVINQALLSITNGSIGANNSFYIYKNILTSNSSLRSASTIHHSSANLAYRNLKVISEREKLIHDLDQIYDALTKTKLIIDTTAILLQSAIPTSEGSLGLTNTEINSKQSINTTHQSQINQAITSVDSARNNLASTVTNNNLLLEQTINKLTLAENEYNNTEFALESARNSATIEKTAAQNQFDNAAYNFSNLSFPSPFSGTILSHFVNPGMQVNPGQELIEIGDLSIVEISVDIDASFIDALLLGDPVIINDDVEGFISEIEPSGDVGHGKAGVVVQSENSEDIFVTGDIADVIFILTFKENGLIVIPIKAVTVEETGMYVLIIDDGIAQRRRISLGKVFGSQVSVVSGLNVGEQIILSDGVFVSEDDAVEVIE